MATRGNSKNIIVGAAQVWVGDENLEWVSGTGNSAVYEFPSDPVANTKGVPGFTQNVPFADTMETEANTAGSLWSYVGFTSNGLELQFQPDFGEVQVDQLLDVAKMYKQGMQVSLNTTMAEATLENLLVAIAGKSGANGDLLGSTLWLSAGELGECPVERAIVAVGPGSGDCNAAAGEAVERVYVAHRALSIDSVTVSAKRDEATSFAVSFRLLPASNGKYGKIVDRTVGNIVQS